MASSAGTHTYLQLAPEMGGLRFGPFTGPIPVGSDARRNQLVLDPNQGIFPSHATLHGSADGTYTIAPAGPDCQVFLIPQGQAHMWPIKAPVQARAGDTVVFGTPSGPRFQIQAQVASTRSAAAIYGDARRTGGERGFVAAFDELLDGLFGPPRATGITGEIARQGSSRLLTRSPFREAYALYTRYRTGAQSNPVVLVSILAVVVSTITAGTVSCSGLGWAVWRAIVA